MAQTAASEDVSERTKQDLRHSNAAQIDQGVTLYDLGHMYWAGFGPGHVPIERDNDFVAELFPKPDVALYSPAFMWPDSVDPSFARGSACPTDEATFKRFIHDIEARNSWMQVHKAPFLSDEGNDFIYMRLSSSVKHPPDGDRPDAKLRVWIQAGVHGNEPAGEQATLAMLGKMNINHTWTNSLLSKMDIMVFPRYNPDGIAAFNRCGGFGLDSNRDHIRFGVSHSKHIRKLFCDFIPHIAIDMHEYSARAKTSHYVHGSDIMFSAAKNLNIHPDIRRISEELFATNIGRKLTKSHFRWEPYVPTSGTKIFFKEAGSEGRIGRNAMGLTQCISFLCESRGIGIADQHFYRRTAASLTFLEGVLETAMNNAELVRGTVDEGIRQFMDGMEDIVVLDKPQHIDRDITLIERNTGRLLQHLVQFVSTTPTVPVLIRQRPQAYLLQPSMSEVAQRLRDLGLVVQMLEYTWTGVVEKLRIESADLGETFTEGIVPMKVATSVSQSTIALQNGVYVIDTRQRNAALAFIALEPENVDSYVSMSIIRVVAGDEYPVYRTVAHIKT